MTVNSFDQLFESLSAMVDNEASELEMRRVLKNMDDNPELLDRWRRYHLIGSVMRKEHGIGATGSGTLATSIANTLSRETEASIAEISNTESAAAKQQSTPSSSIKNVLGKTAIAASFAATLVMGFNYMGTENRGGADSVLASTGQGATPSVPDNSAATIAHAPIGFELPLPEARTVSMTSSGSAMVSNAETRALPMYVDDITDYETQEMLNYLLIQHAERASAHGSLGIMPFARVHKMRMESAAK